MILTTRTLWPVVAALAALASSPAAYADDQITAAPPQRFATPNVTIDQGERVTLVNNDVESHDVTSKGRGSDGARLFKSRLVGSGGTAPVSGTEYLTTGSYAFLCSIHPQMEGTLNVNAAGTPVARPRDSTAPRVSLALLDSRRSKALRRRALRVKVTSGEAATVRISAKRGRRRLGSVVLTLGGAGSRTVELKLSRAARRALAAGRRARVSLSARATDQAGNVGTAARARSLR